MMGFNKFKNKSKFLIVLIFIISQNEEDLSDQDLNEYLSSNHQILSKSPEIIFQKK